MSKNKKTKTEESRNATESSAKPEDMALYYDFVDESLEQHEGIPDLPGNIFFGVQPGAEIPEEILEIQAGIENTTFTLGELYGASNAKRYRQLFAEVLSAAQLLAGPKPSPFVTASVLQRFQERIASSEGKIKKTRYLNKLGIHILFVLAILTVLNIFVDSSWAAGFISSAIQDVMPYYAILFGTATSAMWLSFATRKPIFSFDDLLEPESDMMGPKHRIVYVLLFSAVLALFAKAEVIGAISIGKFSTANISSEYLSAAVFGFACGFSEKLLASTVAPHVSKIMGGLGRAR